MGRQLADLPAEAGQEGAADGPVFVDETGRRSRRYRRIGAVVGLVCAVYAVVIVGTLLSGNSSAPWLPMPGPKDDRPASKVDTPHRTANPADPSASSGVTPSPGATDSADASVSPDEGGRPGPSRTGGDGGGPGATADPDPTNGGGGRPDPDPDPTGGGGGRPDPDPTGGPTDPGPDPTDPTDPVTDPPTQSPEPGGDGAGGGGGGEVPVGYTSTPAQSAPGAQQSTADTKPSSEGAQR
ncbi:hypothetical protein [Streptomyces luteocolor]|uniref:hypothetical protein n=1 Tax=Streptomyces luteocolor TaxID=285500 RepID=UPI000B30BD3A|nr:hypothetical protein [Streptomyces luteocolor]